MKLHDFGAVILFNYIFHNNSEKKRTEKPLQKKVACYLKVENTTQNYTHTGFN